MNTPSQTGIDPGRATRHLPPPAVIDSVNLPRYRSEGGHYREEMLADLDRSGSQEQVEACLRAWQADQSEDNAWRWWWARHWTRQPYARATS